MLIKFTIYYLVCSFLIACTPYVGKAQSSSSNLKGKWKAYTETFEKEYGMIPTNFIYSFEAMGKVSSDSDFSDYKSGTYKVSGDYIRIDFPEYFVNATVKGNRMIGTFTIRGESEKSIWEAERILSENNNSTSQPTESRSTTTGAIDVNALEGLSRKSNANAPEKRNGAIDVDALEGLSVGGKPSQGLIQCKPQILCPAKGYRWINPKNMHDLRVEKIP